MNKKLKIALIIILVFLILMSVIEYFTADGFDEIINYTATVSPRNDGTLDIKYHIEWKVLDSTTEGPLEWVKIGIPNMYVDNIKKISNNISNIKYYSEGGDYIRIDFKRAYNKGEIVTFEFSIHQSHMYKANSQNRKIAYEFIPGWFNDIQVKEAVIKWKAKDVVKHNGKIDGKYIVWNKRLYRGQKIKAKVEYSAGTFDLDYNQQYTKTQNWTLNIKVICVLIILLYIIVLIIEIISPPYYWHRGYGYYPYRHHYHRHCYHGSYRGSRFGGGFGGGRRRKLMRMCMCVRGGWTCRMR